MKLLVNETFKSIQGEGRYAGVPMQFIRLAGCNRKCSFCDTKYHNEVKETYNVKEFISKFVSREGILCFTGGEPLKQDKFFDALYLEGGMDRRRMHLETNGDLLTIKHFFYFGYIAISPKDFKLAGNLSLFLISVVFLEVVMI